MTKEKKVERNQDKLNKLSLDFVSEISKLDPERADYITVIVED